VGAIYLSRRTPDEIPAGRAEYPEAVDEPAPERTEVPAS
jgi:hypothetical protein